MSKPSSHCFLSHMPRSLDQIAWLRIASHRKPSSFCSFTRYIPSRLLVHCLCFWLHIPECEDSETDPGEPTRNARLLYPKYSYFVHSLPYCYNNNHTVGVPSYKRDTVSQAFLSTSHSFEYCTWVSLFRSDASSLF